MAEMLPSTLQSDTPPRRRSRRSSLATRVLRTIAITYVGFLILWPLSLVFFNTFREGISPVFETFTDPLVIHALKLTAITAGWAILLNTLFGLSISILLVRHEFPGKRMLNALIDLPLSVSPVVVGLALVLVFNERDGWFGAPLADAGVQVLFATPGLVLATTFVALPLVIREVVPVLQEIGTEQEQAAHSLGAGGAATFWRVTLPSIKWGLTYGIVLSLARSIGEFGAVKVISGNQSGRTQTATLMVEQFYHNFDAEKAFAIAALLASVSIVLIVIVSFLRTRAERLTRGES